MPKFKPNVLKRTQKLDLISEKNGFRQAVYEWNGIYKGQWEKNMKSGRGIMFYNKNNIIYNGEWKEDMRHGFGKLIRQHYDHGELICEGHWIKNKFVKGICYGRNGVYDGEYLPGTRIKHGFGTMRWNNNSAYTGFWINNKYHGKGTFVEENGCYWDGQWKCGLKNGEGTFVNKLIGQKVNGVWLNGSLVVSTIEDYNKQNANIHPSINPLPKIMQLDLEILNRVFEETKTEFIKQLSQ